MTNVYDFMEEYDRAAQARALDAIDGDPEEASNAVKLGNMSGVPAEAIQGDDEFENRWKGQLTAHLVRNNPHIIDYINSHPLAAKVSNDDIGQLDTISAKMRRVGGGLPGRDAFNTAFEHGLKGFKEGYGEAATSDIVEGLKTAKDAEFEKQFPALYNEFRDLAGLITFGGRLFSGTVGAVKGAAEGAHLAVTGDEAGARQFGRDIGGMAEMQMMGGGPHGMVKPHVDVDPVKYLESVKKALPWLKDGREPPPGISQIMDDIKADQNTVDLKAHKELASEVDKSTTKERVPEFMENFVNLRNKTTIAIPREALERLYGDKEPRPGDNIIGDVSGAQAGYRFGGDVHIPLAEWLTRVPKEIKDELWDDVRFRPDGLTKNEIEDLKAWHKAQEELEAEAAPVAESTREDIEFEQQRIAELEGFIEKERKAAVEAFQEGNELLTTNINERIKRYRERIEVSKAKIAKLSGAEAEPEAPSIAELEAPLPIREMRQAAGIPMGDDVPGQVQAFPVEAGKQVAFGGGRFDTVGSTTVGKAMPHNDWGGGMMQVLRDKIANIAKDVSIHIVRDEDFNSTRFDVLRQKSTVVGAYYDPSLDHIVMSESRWRGPLGQRVLMHETVHAATSRAIFARGAEDVKIIMKMITDEFPHLASKYGFTNEHEFMAEAVSNLSFQNELIRIKIPDKVAEAIGIPEWRKKSLWSAFVDTIQRLLRIDDRGYNALEAALKLTEDFTDIRLTPRELHRFDKWKYRVKGEVEPPEPELGAPPGKEPFEAPDQFEKGQAIGYVENAWKKIQRLVARQREDELAAQSKKAIENAKKKAGAEWKANRADVRREVANTISNHPTPMAAEFFRDSIYNGQSIKGVNAILDIKKLSDAQRKDLPRDFYGRGGLDPDEAASMFGFSSGDEMISQVAAYERDRGKMRPDNYINMLIERETDRRMQEKYGSQAEQTLRLAAEHITNGRHISLLHAEIEYLARLSRQQVPFTKAGILNAVRQGIDLMPQKMVKSKSFFNEAGKAGRAVETAFIKGDYLEAFRQHQAQYIATLRAKEALKLEKEKEKFDNVTSKYEKRDLRGVSGEFTPWIQQMLINHGFEIRRGPQDHAMALEETGFKTFDSFVESKTNDGHDIIVDDRLRTPTDPFNKTKIEDMTVEEWHAVNDAVLSLDAASRSEMKAFTFGQTYRFEQALEQTIELMQARREGKQPPIDKTPQEFFENIKTKIKQVTTAHLTHESMMNWLDKDNPRGLFHQLFVYPFVEAGNGEARMLRVLQKDLVKVVGRIPDLDKKIENTFWESPDKPGEFLDLRRRHLLGILQHLGNPGNLRNLAKSYGKKPEEVIQWVLQRTTKEDWDRAQAIGDLFKPLFDEAIRQSIERSTVPPRQIEIEPIVTPWGTYEGWYHPIDHDKYRPGTSVSAQKGPSKDQLFLPGSIYRPSPAHGYRQERTGYIAPPELTLDVVPARLRQMVHDISFRDPIMNAAKFFYNKDFISAFLRHVGPQWHDMLKPFLHDMANGARFDSDIAAAASSWSEFFRQNTVHGLIGMNPHTVAKHGLTAAVNSLFELGPAGPIKFGRAFFTLFDHKDPFTADRNFQFMMNSSEQMQLRMRNWIENAQLQPTLTLKKSGLRQLWQTLASTPVAISDFMSSGPMWLAQYRESRLQGVTHGQAVFEADRAVRRAHGSSVITNRPYVARSTNPIGAWYTSLYGFFSHMFQKQYELGWKAAETARAGDWPTAWKYGKQLPGLAFSVVFWPIFVEEMVTPYTNSEHESYGLRAAKATILGLASSWIGFREFIHGFINLREPEAGLMGEALKAPYRIGQDLKHLPNLSVEQKGKLIRDLNTLVAVGAGLSSTQVGKAEEFIYRYNHGLEHPKGFEWLRGLEKGTLRERRRR